MGQPVRADTNNQTSIEQSNIPALDAVAGFVGAWSIPIDGKTSRIEEQGVFWRLDYAAQR